MLLILMAKFEGLDMRKIIQGNFVVSIKVSRENFA